MNDYVLSCCSTADLTKQHFIERNINYVCFHFELDGKQYMDDLGDSISFADFYSKMASGCETKTSQVSTGEYEEYFEKFLSQGKDVIHVTLSSGISGSYNSACLAANDLKEKYPDRKLYIVDSLAASGGYGLLMDKLADLRDEGFGIDQLHEWVEENKLRLNHWFFSTDLSFYVKGGRISKTAGAIGSALKICPLLNVDNTGHLIVREKVHGKKKVIKQIANKMFELAENRENYDGKCLITQSACYDDAKAVADLVEQHFADLDGKVIINYIGTTIGSHTGPGTVALFFWGDKRVD